MHEYKHLLAVLNPAGPHQVALQRAAQLARCNGSKISALLPAGKAAAGIRTAIDGQLLQLNEQGLDVALDISAEKDVLRAVLECQHRHDVDLTVKAPQPHSLADEVFTSLDWKLLRSNRTPVLLVHSDAQHAQAPILAAVEAKPADLEHRELSKAILQQAQWLAARLEAPLHLFSAYPAPMQDPMHPDQDPEQQARDYRDACLKLALQHGIAQERVHVAAGPAELLIPERATRLGAQLLVLGTVARTGLRGVLLGNTAEQVLEKTARDVLVIPPIRGE
ncbi:universal stress protein [Marinobacterium rhizophilum]|uniref:universal stress protein n=1 Tax=Marinobacterium rhizophilum TaxID=420402 RepID=UPI0003811EE8|nr:universal stress protein [Marinobacterium rhizophilum]